MNIGTESESAERVRRYRARKAQEKLPKPDEIKALPASENDALHCNGDVTKRNDYIETEQDKETETETEEDIETDIQTEEEALNPRQMERVNFLRELFVGWDFNDYQIFHLSSLVSKRIPYDPTMSFDALDIRIYDILQELVLLAKANNAKYPFKYIAAVIPKYEGIE